MAPLEFELEVNGVSMSGLIAVAEQPRAVIVALHGGASGPEYFDAPGHPEHSLLRVGAALGFTVIAPHRPGYGSSRELLADNISAARQINLMYGLIDEVLRDSSRGAGVFLVAHSQGCVLTLRMAADDRGADLLGVEIAGTGVRHHPRADEFRDRGDLTREQRRPSLRSILWQPGHLYPEGAMVASRGAVVDGADSENWPSEFAVLAGDVACPVRISLGDHEFWWQPGAGGLANMAALFVTSRRVVTCEQIGSGHNLSVGVAALAYHLKVIAFVEECVLALESVKQSREEMEASDV